MISNASNLIMIEGTKEVVSEILAQIETIPEVQYEVAERKNLQGDTAAWIVILTAASQVLPNVINLFSQITNLKRTTKVKCGSLEIENPTEADLEKFWERCGQQSVVENQDG